MITNRGHFKKLAVTAELRRTSAGAGLCAHQPKTFFSDFISFYRNEHPPKKHNV